MPDLDALVPTALPSDRSPSAGGQAGAEAIPGEGTRADNEVDQLITDLRLLDEAEASARSDEQPPLATAAWLDLDAAGEEVDTTVASAAATARDGGDVAADTGAGELQLRQADPQPSDSSVLRSAPPSPAANALAAGQEAGDRPEKFVGAPSPARSASISSVSVSPVASLEPSSPIVSQLLGVGIWSAEGAGSSSTSADRCLQEAALQGDAARVRELIDQGASCNAPMRWSQGCAMEACRYETLLHALSDKRCAAPNVAEVALELARGRANLNARSSLGDTPLARACFRKNVDLAEVLVREGAGTQARDDEYCCALDYAVWLPRGEDRAAEERASGQLVSLLAATGSGISVGHDRLSIHAPNRGSVGSFGSRVSGHLGARSRSKQEIMPPLLRAIQHENAAAVEALLKHGTPPAYLHEALSYSSREVTSALINAKADLFEEDAAGRTAFDIAASHDNEDLMALMSLQRSGPASPRTKANQRRASAASVHLRPRNSGGSLGLGLLSEASSEAGPKYRKLLSRLPTVTFSTTTVSHPGLTLQQFCGRVHANSYYQLLTLVALCLALVLPDLWVLADAASNDGLDSAIIIVFAIFLSEILVQLVYSRFAYLHDSTFYVDVIGLLSVFLDHSIVSLNLPRSFDNTTVLRAARSMRFGARAARFTRLVKLLRFLPVLDGGAAAGRNTTAKKVAVSLMSSLQIRVVFLIVGLVVVLPLADIATYPEADLSMQAWLASLELTLMGSSRPDKELEAIFGDFANFYADKGYYPYEVAWSHGSLRLPGRRPRRDRNRQVIKSQSGSVRAVFDFGNPNRTEAWTNLLLTALIVAMMAGSSVLLSKSLRAHVINPLEEEFRGPVLLTLDINAKIQKIGKKLGWTSPEQDPGEPLSERDALDRTRDRLQALNAAADDFAVEYAVPELHNDDCAVLLGIRKDTEVAGRVFESLRLPTTSNSDQQSGGDNVEPVLSKHLSDHGLDFSLVNSWDFNAYEVEEAQRQTLAAVFIVSQAAAVTETTRNHVATFVEVVAGRYALPTRVPYHNWRHAVDVAHCLFRLIRLCDASESLKKHERFLLLACAVCHDVQHPGLNNPFLVETSHELALRYNDASPLENMHCATMFEISRQPAAAIFGELPRATYREVRAACVDAILHTDMEHHFGMVKALELLYEMSAEHPEESSSAAGGLVEATGTNATGATLASAASTRSIARPCASHKELFRDEASRQLFRNMLLHFSDISNPMKPFHICTQWANLFLAECFAQGDREMELALPLQPLNDREKVNVPHAQIGFIEFLVAPLSISVVRLWPNLLPCVEQMVRNQECWIQRWLDEGNGANEAEATAMRERCARLWAKVAPDALFPRPASEWK
eukprot:TRINITY_DN26639_c0_g1_i1.p1 TRINITY_DN26639_c0_g1~~TRINITY_DN26639_c0_g1_i1.p1  ORF type:complete len:1358 (+),score=323.67 TRINITY_DN26639_c0_g1_i1:209-4282(+)